MSGGRASDGLAIRTNRPEGWVLIGTAILGGGGLARSNACQWLSQERGGFEADLSNGRRTDFRPAAVVRLSGELSGSASIQMPRPCACIAWRIP